MLLLLLISFSSLLSRVQAQLPCDAFSVEHGATWMNISWPLHCNVPEEDIVTVKGYHIVLTDKTTGFYNYNLNVFCTDTFCSEYIDYVRPCIEYSIDVQVELYNGTQHVYDSTAVVMDEEIPSSVQQLKIAGTSSESVSVSWFQPLVGEYCVREYRVCIRVVTEVEPPVEQTCNNTTEMTFVFGGLLSCVEYEVSVRPVTKTGVDGFISSISSETDFQNPGPPSQVRPKISGNSYISFYWTPSNESIHCLKGVAPSCIETGFRNTSRSEKAPGLVLESKLAGLDPMEAYSEVDFLQECTSYRCFVQVPVLDGWITSEVVEMSTSVVGIKLGSPQYLEYNSAADRVSVFWSRPRSAARCVDGYYLSWGTEDLGYETVFRESDQLSYTILGLESCVQYTISVTAYTESWGQVVNGSYASTLATTLTVAPGPVSNLAQLSAEDLSITVCWDAPSENQYCTHDYKVEISFPGAKSTFHSTLPSGADSRVCRSYDIQECSRTYKFCVWPESVDAKSGPPACTDVESAAC